MNKIERPQADTIDLMRELGASGKSAAKRLARATRDEKDTALRAAAASLREQTEAIIEANAIDIAAAREAIRGAYAPYLTDDGVIMDSEAWIVSADKG